ncbi:MAG: hypothetical protein K5981_07355 [Clostridia bacterium]|nr:hypothetical protein [Clostridia bacterium]
MKRRTLMTVLALAVALFLTASSSAATDEYIEPVVFPEEPVPIRTAEELSAIREANFGYYILMDDIDLTDFGEWEPINVRAGYPGWHDMCVRFDGNGHTISGLHGSGGLFGGVQYAEIWDLTVSGDITGGGGFIGQAWTNCLNGEHLTISLVNCHFEGAIRQKAPGFAGGLIGIASIDQHSVYGPGSADLLMENCSFKGTICGEPLTAGGLIGNLEVSQEDNPDVNNAAVIRNCHSQADILWQEAEEGDSLKSSRTGGGLIGSVSSGGTYYVLSDAVLVENCTCSGRLEGFVNEGGLFGTVKGDAGVTVRDCAGDMQIVSCADRVSCIGGIAGSVSVETGGGSARFEHCQVNGSITVDLDEKVNDSQDGHYEAFYSEIDPYASPYPVFVQDKFTTVGGLAALVTTNAASAVFSMDSCCFDGEITLRQYRITYELDEYSEQIWINRTGMFFGEFFRGASQNGYLAACMPRVEKCTVSGSYSDLARDRSAIIGYEKKEDLVFADCTVLGTPYERGELPDPASLKTGTPSLQRFLLETETLTEAPAGWAPVYSLEDYLAIGESDGCFILMNDIDATDMVHSPAYIPDAFCGGGTCLNGNGFCMFGLGASCRNLLENLGLQGGAAYVRDSSDNTLLDAVIHNCWVDGDERYCSFEAKMITDCVNYAPIRGDVCAPFDADNLRGCVNYGDVHALEFGGGIVADFSAESVYYRYDSNVFGHFLEYEFYVADYQLEDCTNYGDIILTLQDDYRGEYFAGGIAGRFVYYNVPRHSSGTHTYSRNGKTCLIDHAFTNCKNYGSVTIVMEEGALPSEEYEAKVYAGGIAGRFEFRDDNTSFFLGNGYNEVLARTYGEEYYDIDTLAISGCASEGDVLANGSCTVFAGGIFGQMDLHTEGMKVTLDLTDLQYKGNVLANGAGAQAGSSACAGGIIGDFPYADYICVPSVLRMTRCLADTQDIRAIGGDDASCFAGAGGLIGRFAGDQTSYYGALNWQISDCEAFADAYAHTENGQPAAACGIGWVDMGNDGIYSQAYAVAQELTVTVSLDMVNCAFHGTAGAAGGAENEHFRTAGGGIGMVLFGHMQESDVVMTNCLFDTKMGDMGVVTDYDWAYYGTCFGFQENYRIKDPEKHTYGFYMVPTFTFRPDRCLLPEKSGFYGLYWGTEEYEANPPQREFWSENDPREAAARLNLWVMEGDGHMAWSFSASSPTLFKGVGGLHEEADGSLGAIAHPVYITPQTADGQVCFDGERFFASAVTADGLLKGWWFSPEGELLSEVQIADLSNRKDRGLMQPSVCAMDGDVYVAFVLPLKEGYEATLYVASLRYGESGISMSFVSGEASCDQKPAIAAGKEGMLLVFMEGENSMSNHVCSLYIHADFTMEDVRPVFVPEGYLYVTDLSVCWAEELNSFLALWQENMEVGIALIPEDGSEFESEALYCSTSWNALPHALWDGERFLVMALADEGLPTIYLSISREDGWWRFEEETDLTALEKLVAAAGAPGIFELAYAEGKDGSRLCVWLEEEDEDRTLCWSFLKGLQTSGFGELPEVPMIRAKTEKGRVRYAVREDAPEDAVVLAACYDADGRFIGLSAASEGLADSPDEDETLRLFLIDADLDPLCEPVSP